MFIFLSIVKHSMCVYSMDVFVCSLVPFHCLHATVECGLLHHSSLLLASLFQVLLSSSYSILFFHPAGQIVIFLNMDYSNILIKHIHLEPGSPAVLN